MFLDLDSWFVGKVFTTRLPRNASMKTLKKKKEKKMHGENQCYPLSQVVNKPTHTRSILAIQQ